ncbi:MAG: oligosaccharide flippase family protein [Bacteroidales bacterium]|nr:oligosaccharide flippase family protein [Bacteroidales bacterium]
MNHLKQLFAQTAVYGLGTVIPRLLNYLLLTPFFTRVFLLGEYGIVTELYAYVVFLLVILTYGMETGFFRYAEKHSNSNEVYSTSLISLFSTSGLFIVIMWILARPIAGFIGYGDNPEYIVWIGIIVGLDSFMAIPFARLRQQKKAVKFAVIKIANVVVNISLNLLFLLFLPGMSESGVHSIPEWLYNSEIGVGYVFISNMAASLFTLILLSGEFFNIALTFNKKLWRRMIVYSLPLLVSGLAGTVNEALDRVLLKHLIPKELNPLDQLGIYGANYKIAVMLQLFIQMFRFASEPFYFTRARDRNAKKLFADIMKYFVIICMVIFLGVTLYIDIFKFFIGERFHAGLHIVPIVLYAIFFLGVFFNLSIWYKLKNLTKFGALITITGAVITFLINWFFIPRYGFTASAWAHFFCYLTMVIMSYFLGRKYYRIQYDIKRILFYAILLL